MTTADYDVAMDYSAMGTLAQQVETAQADFSDMRKKLDSLTDSLNGKWEGKAQKEFSSAYEKLQRKLKTIDSVLTEYAKDIRETAEQEAVLETNSAKSYENTAFPVVDHPTLK